jgi:hypothetical protein
MTISDVSPNSAMSSPISLMTSADVISAFLSETTNETLVHKLERKSLWTTKELLDIATNHAFDEDTVG